MAGKRRAASRGRGRGAAPSRGRERGAAPGTPIVKSRRTALVLRQTTLNTGAKLASRGGAAILEFPATPTPLPVREQVHKRRSLAGFRPRIVELDPETDRTVMATPAVKEKRLSIVSGVSEVLSWSPRAIVSSTRVDTPTERDRVRTGGGFVRPFTPPERGRVKGAKSGGRKSGSGGERHAEPPSDEEEAMDEEADDHDEGGDEEHSDDEQVNEEEDEEDHEDVDNHNQGDNSARNADVPEDNDSDSEDAVDAGHIIPQSDTLGRPKPQFNATPTSHKGISASHSHHSREESLSGSSSTTVVRHTSRAGTSRSQSATAEGMETSARQAKVSRLTTSKNLSRETKASESRKAQSGSHRDSKSGPARSGRDVTSYKTRDSRSSKDVTRSPKAPETLRDVTNRSRSPLHDRRQQQPSDEAESDSSEELEVPVPPKVTSRERLRMSRASTRNETSVSVKGKSMAREKTSMNRSLTIAEDDEEGNRLPSDSRDSRVRKSRHSQAAEKGDRSRSRASHADEGSRRKNYREERRIQSSAKSAQWLESSQRHRRQVPEAGDATVDTSRRPPDPYAEAEVSDSCDPEYRVSEGERSTEAEPHRQRSSRGRGGRTDGTTARNKSKSRPGSPERACRCTVKVDGRPRIIRADNITDVLEAFDDVIKSVRGDPVLRYRDIAAFTDSLCKVVTSLLARADDGQALAAKMARKVAAVRQKIDHEAMKVKPALLEAYRREKLRQLDEVDAERFQSWLSWADQLQPGTRSGWTDPHPNALLDRMGLEG